MCPKCFFKSLGETSEVIYFWANSFRKGYRFVLNVSCFLYVEADRHIYRSRYWWQNAAILRQRYSQKMLINFENWIRMATFSIFRILQISYIRYHCWSIVLCDCTPTDHFDQCINVDETPPPNDRISNDRMIDW